MAPYRVLPLVGLCLALVGLLAVVSSFTAPSAPWPGAVLAAGVGLLAAGAVALFGHWRRSRAGGSGAWDTPLTLQALTLGAVVVGLFGVAASYAGLALLTWTGREALLVGGGLVAVGTVMFADLRRRGWGRRSPPGTTGQ